jgi:peroxiredoxin
MSLRIFRGRRLHAFVRFTAAVTLLLVAAVQIAWCAEEKGILNSLFGSSGKEVGAIDFELKDLNDSPVRLSQFRGNRYVLVYFWATWCPYCLAVKPEIQKIRDRIPAQEMEILAINVGGGDSIERLKKYQEGHPVPYPVLYDGNGGVTRAYQVQGIPLFLLVNKEGNIVFKDNMLPPDITKYMK